jgi:hypothetical protein
VDVADEHQQAGEVLGLGNPNSLAALMNEVSPPAFASPTILAFEACACSSNEEKSDADNGCRTAPSTLPPVSFTTFMVSCSSEWPKA